MTSVSLHPADSHQQGSRQTQRRPRWLKHTASALSCPGGLGDSVWSKATVARRHFCCRFAMREFVKVKKRNLFFEQRSLDFTNAGGPAGAAGTPSASQRVHQPGAEVNQRWAFSDSVVSGGGTLCPLAGTSISLSPSHSVPSPVSPGEIRHVH